jgi:hypothetical protein
MKRDRVLSDPHFTTTHISASAPQLEQVIDLNCWHHAIHRVTGAMAVKFNRATPADLERWARMLRIVADEMEADRR